MLNYTCRPGPNALMYIDPPTTTGLIPQPRQATGPEQSHDREGRDGSTHRVHPKRVGRVAPHGLPRKVGEHVVIRSRVDTVGDVFRVACRAAAFVKPVRGGGGGGATVMVQW